MLSRAQDHEIRALHLCGSCERMRYIAALFREVDHARSNGRRRVCEIATRLGDRIFRVFHQFFMRTTKIQPSERRVGCEQTRVGRHSNNRELGVRPYQTPRENGGAAGGVGRIDAKNNELESASVSLPVVMACPPSAARGLNTRILPPVYIAASDSDQADPARCIGVIH